MVCAGNRYRRGRRFARSQWWRLVFPCAPDLAVNRRDHAFRVARSHKLEGAAHIAPVSGMRKVAACRVFLAVIGPNWLDAKDESGVRRLDNPDDFVTIEIAAALARDIRVIPVLVDNARMPKADKLPEHIRPLVRRNAVEVRNTQFRRDAETLVARMREALGQKAGGQGRWRVRAAAGAAAVAVAVAVVVVVGWFAWISPPQPRDIGDTPPPVSVYSALIPTLRLLLMENK
jgi:hypothetical protein